MKNKLTKDNWALIFGLSFCFIVILYSVIRDTYKDNMLENYSESFAVFVRSTKETVSDGPSAIFKFEVEGKYYQFRQSGNFNNLKSGDIVQIKYSTKDPNVVKVTNASRVWK